jgi:hypothetical protein
VRAELDRLNTPPAAEDDNGESAPPEDPANEPDGGLNPFHGRLPKPSTRQLVERYGRRGL